MKKIPLTQGKFALVDDADYLLVNQFKWYANLCHGVWYARRNVVLVSGKKTCVALHRFLCPEIPQIDHRNKNGLDNQRHNLRAATHRQNKANSRKQINCISQYKGVTWHKRHQKWYAQISAQGKVRFLGLHTSEVEAAKAYDSAARNIFGEFASPNFSA